jgi:hypothetical protein
MIPLSWCSSALWLGRLWKNDVVHPVLIVLMLIVVFKGYISVA